MSSNVFELIIVPVVVGFVSAFSGWFFGRRKQDAETKGSEIENAERALQYYRQMVDDMGLRLTKAIEELQTTNIELKATKKVIKELEEKVEAMTDELKKYKQLNGKI